VLEVDGQAGRDTRKALFARYMDWLCTPAERTPSVDGAQPLMQPSDFLGGAGARLGDLPKMSLQSCGEFNPVMLLTSAEMSAAEGTGASTRNDDDAPNRRVLMFFFPKGTTVDPGVWPCPKVNESHGACRLAFWPGGDKRRRNGAEQREYRVTRDTMACRFYDRFARRSPCEGAPVRMLTVIIRLIADGLGESMPPRPYKLSVRGATPSGFAWDVDVVGTTDDDGYVRARVPPGTTTGTLIVQHTEDDGTQTDVWSVDLEFQDLAPADSVQGAQARLANLGLQPGRIDGTLDACTQRAINRFRELHDLPIVPPSTPADPTPQISTLLASDTVERLLALYEAHDTPPADGPNGTFK
jgi:hypothetical protein